MRPKNNHVLVSRLRLSVTCTGVPAGHALIRSIICLTRFERLTVSMRPVARVRYNVRAIQGLKILVPVAGTAKEPDGLAPRAAVEIRLPTASVMRHQPEGPFVARLTLVPPSSEAPASASGDCPDYIP